MNRAEQIWLAQEKTYNEIMENDDQYCHPESFRWGFEQGVDWAEKDLALTCEDVKSLIEIWMNLPDFPQRPLLQIAEETLNIFNEQRKK